LEIKIRVRDNGPGVPQELREAFSKGQRSGLIHKHKKGAGVGITISRRLAEAHGGSLYLDAQCRETCFVLSLPRPRSRYQAA